MSGGTFIIKGKLLKVRKNSAKEVYYEKINFIGNVGFCVLLLLKHGGGGAQ